MGFLKFNEFPFEQAPHELPVKNGANDKCHQHPD